MTFHEEARKAEFERLKYVNERIEYWESLPSFKFSATEAREESNKWRTRQAQILSDINRLTKIING